MALQSLPAAASEYARSQRIEFSAALSAVKRSWGRMGDDFDSSYAQIEPILLAITNKAQRMVTAGAREYIPEVLAETAPRAHRPDYTLRTDALTGTTGAGWAVEDSLYGSVIRAKTAVSSGLSTSEALRSGGLLLLSKVGTLLSDTARTVERVESNARGVGVFVRMLNPPSCGRCVILAGKRSGDQEAFDRHPGCDCRNIPAAESIADDFTTDPRAYLDQLDDQGLSRALGSKANAAAFRDGADMNQLINAYRKTGDVRPAQVYGRMVKYTTEGTTRRGRAFRAMQKAPWAQAEVNRTGERYARMRAPRLMPESIYSIAKDSADAKRLLRIYGWIL